MKKTRIAQLGVGYWGPNLLRNTISNPRADLVSVCDLSAERREFIHKTYPGVATTDSSDSIINDPSIEAVIIATPAGTHFELATKALKAGKHILVEKPLANTVEEVKQINQLAADQKLVVMVGHTFIYSPAVHYLRDLINSGELGQVRYIYSQRLNLGRIRSDCDVLWNLGPHDISIVQFLLGDPAPISVSRTGMDYVQKGIDDVVFVNITYPNRVIANFHLSWLDPGRARSMTIVGSEKMVVYDDAKENKIAIYDKGIDRMHVLGENMDYDKPVLHHRSGKVVEPEISKEEPLKVEINHFIDCIQHDVECWTGPEHAAKVVKILTDCKKKSQVNSESRSPFENRGKA